MFTSTTNGYSEMLEGIEEVENDITDLEMEISEAFDRLRTADGAEVESGMREVSSKLYHATNRLEMLRLELKELPEHARGQWQILAERHAQRLAENKSKLAREQKRHKREALGDAAVTVNTEDMTPMEIIQRAANVQTVAQESLARSKAMVAESEEIGERAQEQLLHQREQLARIGGDLNSMSPHFRNAGMHIKEFTKKMESDKCIMGLMMLILAGGFLIVVLKPFAPEHGFFGSPYRDAMDYE